MTLTKEEYEAAINDGYEEATAWKPIDTAPKDQTEILACWDAPTPQYKARGVIRWFLYDRGACDDEGYWATLPGYWRKEPTHWQPLPPAPTAGQE